MSTGVDRLAAALAVIDAATTRALEPYRMLPVHTSGGVVYQHLATRTDGQGGGVSCCGHFTTAAFCQLHPVKLAAVDCVPCLDALERRFR